MKTEKIETINPDNYIGDECSVIKAEYIALQHGEVLKIIGENVELKGDDSLPEGKTLNPSAVFGLHKNKDGEIIIGEDSKLHKFLKSKNIDPAKMPEYEEGLEVAILQGIKCKIQKNKNNFLDLV